MSTFAETYPCLAWSVIPGGKTHAAQADGSLACRTQIAAGRLTVVAGVDRHERQVTCRACRVRRRDWTQPKHEAGDVADMVRGGMRGLVRRAGEGDIDALRELVALQATLQNAITDAGTLLHNYGHSYTLLAAELDVSRQAARQRFTRRAALPSPAKAGA